MTLSDGVRDRLRARLSPSCPCCGLLTFSPMTVADAARASGVGRKVIRRFLKGGVIWSSHLDQLDRWLG